MKAYKLVLTLAIAGLVIQGPFAYADAETFESAKSGDWDKPATWDCPGGECDHPYPVAGDTATVLQDHVVDVDNPQAVTTLTVNMKTDGTAGGVLDMQANARLDILASLTVQADATDPGVFRFSATSGDTPELRAAGPTVTIFGLIQTTGSQGATISRTNDYTFALDSDAEVLADGGDITITAPMLINGTARATSSADLIFVMNAPAPGSTGLIHVDSSTAQVFFNPGSTQTYTGTLDFYAEAGEIVINDSQSTAGGTRIDATGKMDIAADESYSSSGPF